MYFKVSSKSYKMTLYLVSCQRMKIKSNLWKKSLSYFKQKCLKKKKNYKKIFYDNRLSIEFKKNIYKLKN